MERGIQIHKWTHRIEATVWLLKGMCSELKSSYVFTLGPEYRVRMERIQEFKRKKVFGGKQGTKVLGEIVC